MASGAGPDERCPICQSDRYLRPNMKLLINAECYHRMCESCVDRIFATGPAPCPHVGCGRILRKAKFREQTFDDTRVEREVDARRRIRRIYNKRESEFPSLQDYNNYLEHVEEITFNLVHGIDVEATEREVAEYERQNRSDISSNLQLSAQEAHALRLAEAARQQEREETRDMLLRAEAEERRERGEQEQDLIRQLAASSGRSADQVVEQQRAAQARRQQSAHESRLAASQAAAALNARRRARMAPSDRSSKPSVSGPFSPMNGAGRETKLFTVAPAYQDPWLASMRADKARIAGGMDVDQIHQRALFEAFACLRPELT